MTMKQPDQTVSQGERTHISVLDASNYFRGLLLLIKKDRQVTSPEVGMMKSVGKSLGFDAEFCETAIHEILDNAYIADVPPVFASAELAKKFIRDGLALSFVDHDQIDPGEDAWLRMIAEQNNLGESFYASELEHARANRGKKVHLEVFDLVVKYY